MDPSHGASPSLEAMAQALDATGDFLVLRRFVPPTTYDGPSPSGVRRGLIVDVETTGLDWSTDAIIEFGAVPFEFDREGRVYDVHAPLEFFEDPGRPIPDDVIALTGITDAMVRGQRIDDAAVQAALDSASLVIAHNAGFDRKFLERRFPAFAQKHWACSQTEVAWERFGCRGRKLDYLMFRCCGLFHTGHRAADDCQATLHVLATPRNGEQSPLQGLLERARRTTHRVWATASPFDSKDTLRSRGYKWHGGSAQRAKAWYRDLGDREAMQAELEWLREAVYAPAPSAATTQEFTAKERYSERTGP